MSPDPVRVEPVTSKEWMEHGTSWQDQNMDRAPSDYWRKKALKRQAEAVRCHETMQIQGELTLRQAWTRLSFETKAGVVFFTLLTALLIAGVLTS